MPKTKKEDPMKHNYQVSIKGQVIQGEIQTMTEAQAKIIAKHFLDTAYMKDFSVHVKRITPEPYTFNIPPDNATTTFTGPVVFDNTASGFASGTRINPEG